MIGLSLVSGVLVRIASASAVLYMLNFLLSEWMGPGPHAPVWQYFGAQLDHLALLFLFLIFFADNASQLSLRMLLSRSRKI
jgi:thiosulfate dehydrogenase [quinone] large subunit